MNERGGRVVRLDRRWRPPLKADFVGADNGVWRFRGWRVWEVGLGRRGYDGMDRFSDGESWSIRRVRPLRSSLIGVIRRMVVKETVCLKHSVCDGGKRDWGGESRYGAEGNGEGRMTSRGMTLGKETLSVRFEFCGRAPINQDRWDGHRSGLTTRVCVRSSAHQFNREEGRTVVG